MMDVPQASAHDPAAAPPQPPSSASASASASLAQAAGDHAHLGHAHAHLGHGHLGEHHGKWDGARSSVASKMLPRAGAHQHQQPGAPPGLTPRQSVLVHPAAPAPPSADDLGDALHSVVAKKSFAVRHATALREQMEAAGRSTEKVNLFTQSSVLSTVRSSWIKHAETLDRMYIDRDEDRRDEEDAKREAELTHGSRAQSELTQRTFDAWDLILVSRARAMADVNTGRARAAGAADAEEGPGEHRSRAEEELQRESNLSWRREAAEINKLSTLRIRTRRSAGDDRGRPRLSGRKGFISSLGGAAAAVQGGAGAKFSGGGGASSCSACATRPSASTRRA